MGRTDGKLIPFLRGGLQDNSFVNLKWQDINSQIFSLTLPRFDEKKNLEIYENVLIEWYNINRRGDVYPGYSGGKSVIQASMKKSVYLVTLGSFENHHFFKFATKAEEEVKRKLQKLKSNLKCRNQQKLKSKSKCQDPIQDDFSLQSTLEQLNESIEPVLQSSPSPPLSPSSGYQSDNGDFDETMEITENKISEDSDVDTVLDDLLRDPDSFMTALKDVDLGNEDLLFNDIMEDGINSISDEFKLNDEKYSQPTSENNSKPVEELAPTEVHSLKILSTYWLCTKKVKLSSTLLLLMCEKQAIQDEDAGFVAGQIYLGNVFEPGESYYLQKMFELDGKCFLLFQN